MKQKSSESALQVPVVYNLRKCFDARRPVGIEPGVYYVLLELTQCVYHPKHNRLCTIRTSYRQLSRITGLSYRAVRRTLDWLVEQQFCKLWEADGFLNVRVLGLVRGGEKPGQVAEAESTNRTMAKTPKPRCKTATGFTPQNGGVAATTLKEETENEEKPLPRTPSLKEEKEKEENPQGLLQTSSATHTKGASRFSASLEQRSEAFKEQVRPFVAQYGADMCNEFYLYWAEPTQDGARMRFELQRTWSTARRLAYWVRHASSLAPKGSRSRSASAQTPQVARDLTGYFQRIADADRQRDRQREQAVPRWAYLKLQKLGLLGRCKTATDFMKVLNQLAVMHQLDAEELALFERWKKQL